jgi:hypothetical protein
MWLFNRPPPAAKPQPQPQQPQTSSRPGAAVRRGRPAPPQQERSGIIANVLSQPPSREKRGALATVQPVERSLWADVLSTKDYAVALLQNWAGAARTDAQAQEVGLGSRLSIEGVRALNHDAAAIWGTGTSHGARSRTLGGLWGAIRARWPNVPSAFPFFFAPAQLLQQAAERERAQERAQPWPTIDRFLAPVGSPLVNICARALRTPTSSGGAAWIAYWMGCLDGLRACRGERAQTGAKLVPPPPLHAPPLPTCPCSGRRVGDEAHPAAVRAVRPDVQAAAGHGEVVGLRAVLGSLERRVQGASGRTGSARASRTGPAPALWAPWSGGGQPARLRRGSTLAPEAGASCRAGWGGPSRAPLKGQGECGLGPRLLCGAPG